MHLLPVQAVGGEAPGRAFSTTKSDDPKSRLTASAADADRKSIATLRFPELSDRNRTDSSPSRSVPCSRYGSPAGGTSSLMTSAPSAASSAVVCEPATKRVRSSTRSPSSGATTGAAPGTRRTRRGRRRTARRAWLPLARRRRAAAGRCAPRAPPSPRRAIVAEHAAVSRARTRSAVRATCRSTTCGSRANASGSSTGAAFGSAWMFTPTRGRVPSAMSRSIR